MPIPKKSINSVLTDLKLNLNKLPMNDNNVNYEKYERLIVDKIEPELENAKTEEELENVKQQITDLNRTILSELNQKISEGGKKSRKSRKSRKIKKSKKCKRRKTNRRK